MKNPWNKIVAASFLILLLCLTVFVQQLKRAQVKTEKEFAADLEQVPCDNQERLAAVKTLFIKLGAADTDLNVQKFEKLENLVVTKPGRTRETVVVGAHFDKTSAGCGAIDNWTGIVIVANLYASLKDAPTEKTYKFVAFGDEEKGLLGSRAMAKAIPEDDIQNYCAMVNFDSFGFSYPQAMGNTTDKDLIKPAEEVAKAFDVPFGSADIGAALADSVSFNDRKIPAVTFHGLSDNWKDYLHSGKDKTENIKIGSVYLGYLFGLSFLNKVDAAECGAFR